MSDSVYHNLNFFTCLTGIVSSWSLCLFLIFLALLKLFLVSFCCWFWDWHSVAGSESDCTAATTSIESEFLKMSEWLMSMWSSSSNWFLPMKLQRQQLLSSVFLMAASRICFRVGVGWTSDVTGRDMEESELDWTGFSFGMMVTLKFNSTSQLY